MEMQNDPTSTCKSVIIHYDFFSLAFEAVCYVCFADDFFCPSIFRAGCYHCYQLLLVVTGQKKIRRQNIDLLEKLMGKKIDLN